MQKQSIKVKGSRYFVFNEDFYDASGGMYDCELITDDLEEAEALAIELSKNEYYPDSAGVLDLDKKEYYSFVKGKRHTKSDQSIKFI